MVLTTIMAVDHIIGSISGSAKSEKLACIIFCLIDPIFVATRFCSRWTVSQTGRDDWMSLVAFVGPGPSLVAYTITDEFFQFSVLSCNIQTLVGEYPLSIL